ncbi:MAG TPA: DUF885 domain-containing protein [Longimicrobium sp.]|nr:DUF885 domain-containing protein [Longimicrobium sp.]
MPSIRIPAPRTLRGARIGAMLSILTLSLAATPAPASAQAGASSTAHADSVAARVTAVADEYVREYKATFPENAIFSGFGDVRPDRLSDNSLAALAAWQRKEDAWAEELGRIDARALWGRPEWVTYGFVREAIDASRQMRVCRNELWGINHMSGWQNTMSDMASQQEVGSPEARSRALRRWGDLPRYVDTEIANLREGVRLGYTAPRRLVELLIPQIDGYVEVPPDSSPLAAVLKNDGTPEFRAAFLALVRDSINPALRRYRDFLANEYMAKAREAFGVSANPNGRACWEASFRQYTSLTRTPEETSRLGEATVARYEREALEEGRRVFGAEGLASLRRRLDEDPRNHFTSREELVQFTRENIRHAREVMPRYFNHLPRADVVVEPIPAFMEATASSNYQPAPQDGSRPAVFAIKLYGFERQQRGTAEVTAFHETYPGHHLQFGAAQGIGELHRVSQLAGNGAYIEGWGRYAETLAEEMELYSPAGRIARRMWPGHGSVLDPGIHLFGWTREQAEAYVGSAGRPGAQARAQVDRVIALPAQLTSYDTGSLEIFALRERAQRELGPRFDLKAFHDAVLANGAVTLPMLREQVERWIDARKAGR